MAVNISLLEALLGDNHVCCFGQPAIKRTNSTYVTQSCSIDLMAAPPADFEELDISEVPSDNHAHLAIDLYLQRVQPHLQISRQQLTSADSCLSMGSL